MNSDNQDAAKLGHGVVNDDDEDGNDDGSSWTPMCSNIETNTFLLKIGFKQDFNKWMQNVIDLPSS